MQRGNFRGRTRGGDPRGGGRGQGGGGRGQGGGGRGRGGQDRGGRGQGEGRGGMPGFRGVDRGGQPGFSGGSRGRGRGATSGPVIFSPNCPSDIDPKLISEGDRVVKSFQTLKVKGGQDVNELLLRPDYGKEGRAIKVRVNHFTFNNLPKGTLYEYKISFDPEVKIKRVRKRLLQILESIPEYQPYKNAVAHDWSEKLIAAKKLPSKDNKPLEIKLKLFEEEETGPSEDAKSYTITFTLVNEINSEHLESYLNGSQRSYNVSPLLSALNIILAKYPSGLGNGIRVGRDRFFFKFGEIHNLGAGLEARSGFYSSVRPTVNSLMVNVNVCYTAFYKQQNLADAIEEFRSLSFGGRVDRYIEGIRVTPTHLKYRPKKSVRKVSNKSAHKERFQCQELGGMVTVAQYFERKYKIRLRKPELLVDLGTKDKSNLVPAELCEILPDQPFKGKLSDSHTAAMIKYARNSPGDNARSIVTQGLSSLGLAGTTGQSLNTFGVTISSEMAVVPARILDPPQIQYAQNKVAELNKEKASWNLQSRRFFRGQSLNRWGIFVIKAGPRDFVNSNDPALLSVIAAFKDSCTACGMSVTDQFIVRGADISTVQHDGIHNKLANALEAVKDVSFLLVILSNGDKRVYATIRRICDVELGIPATCVLSAKIREERGQRQYMANVALKINAKLGGINHALSNTSSRWLLSEVTMLVGMDVTHPGPGSVKGTPSIAGVVASYDPDHCLYPASLRLQESRKEMIVELTDMMIERLLLFKGKRNRLPDRIIVFRDGVSEGQFVTVLREEYPKFLEAFKRVGGPGKPYRPKLTMIICAKRHHTRFFPTTSENADQLGNPKPGTVVDRGVTAIYEFDFFLQAHAGLQGQTRPTHYIIIHDENKFGADAVQGLINYSSYMFARATKAVSLVPPAYYADLVCERGRCFIHDLLNSASGSVSGKSGEDEVFRQAQQSWGRGIHNKVSGSMFYL